MKRAAGVAMLLAAVLCSHAPPVSAQVEGRATECTDSVAWSALIQAHLVRYPLMEIGDLYKLLHQATMGSEHALPDRAVPEQWLLRELAEMGDGPDEPLVDRLGEPSGIARVHLRPFLAAGGDPERLVDGFVATASPRYTRPPMLECALETAREMGATGVLPWSAAGIREFLRTQARGGFPAVHHSDAFNEAYRPAYRVIAVDQLPTVLAGIAGADGRRPSPNASPLVAPGGVDSVRHP